MPYGNEHVKRPTVFLVNPWVHDFAAYDLWARPLGLLLLGTRLRRLGVEPILIDCMDSKHSGLPHRKAKPDGRGRFPKSPIEKPECIKFVPRTFSRYGVSKEILENHLSLLSRPDAIFVTSLMTYWYTGVKETITLFKRLFQGVPIVLGGVYATLMPQHARQSCEPDILWTGPAENGLREILADILGLSLPGADDYRKPEFSPCLDLMSHVTFLPLLTSRGCPMRCSYCASGKLFPKFVARPVQDAIASIEAAVNMYGIRDVVVYDDAFLYNAETRAIPILLKSAERFPGLRWHAPNGLHVRYITRDVAFAMKQASFETIRLGLESSADSFHKQTGSKTARAEFVEAMANLRDAGFTEKDIAAYLLVGIPGQTRGQIEDDVDFVLSCGATPKLAEYSPIPGTAMWASAIKQKRYDIEREPLYHNCTLLPAAEEGVDSGFLAKTRRKISEQLLLTV